MYFLNLAGSALVTTLMGWALAHFLLPRQLKQYSLGLAPMFGFGYIVFTSYICFRLNLEGTNSYAFWLATPPIMALVALACAGQLKLADQDRVSVMLYGCTLLILSQLFLIPEGRSLSLSLGNLDIAEYASEARYVQEFRRDTTLGVFGEYPMGRMIDTMWASPGLFCAFLSTILGSAPFQLQSIALVLIAAQGPVMVWLVAREGLELRKEVSLIASLLYIVNPIACYIVWQSFGAQAQAVPLILGAIAFFMVAMKQEDRWRGRLAYIPALVLTLSALFLTYHFMMPVTALLLGFYLLILALTRLSFADLLSGASLLAISVGLSLALNPLRVMAMVSVLNTLWSGESGWFIPWVSPEAQLGFGAAAILIPGSSPTWLRPLGLVLVIALSVFCLVQLVIHRKAERIALVVGLCVTTVLLGFGLAIVSSENGDLGSYRSFKVTGTFVPLLILALAIPFSEGDWTKKWSVRAIGLTASAAIAFIGLRGQGSMIWLARNTPQGYVMPADFPEIQKLESMGVPGVNFIDTQDNFDIFWAHYFTLKKKQVFQRFPYGRPVHAFDQPYTVAPAAPLLTQGNQDIFIVEQPPSPRRVRLNSKFDLFPAPEVVDVSLSLGDGWWGKEPTHRWTGATGRLAILHANNGGRPIPTRLVGRIGDLRAGDQVMLAIGSQPVSMHAVPGGVESDSFVLPEGKSDIRLTAALDPQQAPAPDTRTVGVMWYELRLVLGQIDSSAAPADIP